MDQVTLIKIQGRTLDNLPEEYTEEQYNQEYSRQEEIVATEKLRAERNKRLTDCDWVAIRAFTTGTPVPEEWKAYMQALRDLPANTEDPENPVWPTIPE